MERKYRGKIIVAPRSENHGGWIYDEINDQMARLFIIKQEQIVDFRVGVHVRYNERKRRIWTPPKGSNSGSTKSGKSSKSGPSPPRNEYVISAHDVLPVLKVEREVVESYLTSDSFQRYKAKRFMLNRKMRIDEDRCIEFKYIPLRKKDFDRHCDAFQIIEHSEHYLNAFLNGNGGCILFGIQDDGNVVGQDLMTKNKRDYIRNAIGQRLSHFEPPVPPEFYSVEFREIVDCEGLWMYFVSAFPSEDAQRMRSSKSSNYSDCMFSEDAFMVT